MRNSHCTTFNLIEFNKEQNETELENQKQALLEKIGDNRRTADANQLINGKIRQDLEVAKATIEYLQTELTTTRGQLTEQIGETEELSELFDNYQGETQKEIQELRDVNLDLIEKYEDIQLQLDQSGLYFDTSLVDIENANITITENETFTDSISTGLGELELEVFNIDFNDLSTQEIEQKESEIKARLTTIYDWSLVPDTGSSGGGFPIAARDALTNTQNKTIELTAKSAGIDISTITEFPIPSWQVTESNNPFSQIIDNLLPSINNGEIPDVQFEELKTEVNNEVNNSITTAFAGIGLTAAAFSQLLNNTSNEAIKNATESAVCQNTQPEGCITNNVTNPLKNAMNNLKDNLDVINAFLNSTILGIVQNTNAVVNSGWASTAMDKTLNAANFALSLHNAMMLSTNIAETVLETISIVLETVGVTDFEGNPINVTEWLTTKIRQVIEGIIGAENYAELSLKLTVANRIYQAGMNILDNVTDLIDTTIELDEYTGENISKIGNALRDSGIVPYDAYEQMIEDLDNRKFSKWLTRIEQAEEATDNIYSIADSIKSIKDISTELKESRGEFDTALEESKTVFTEAETALDTAIESTPEPTEEDETRG